MIKYFIIGYRKLRKNYLQFRLQMKKEREENVKKNLKNFGKTTT